MPTATIRKEEVRGKNIIKLKEVQDQIEKWRSIKKRKNERIPEPIIGSISKLFSIFSQAEVSRELKLSRCTMNYIKKSTPMSQLSVRSKKSKVLWHEVPNPLLHSESIFETKVSIRRVDGSIMEMELSKSVALEAITLFLRGGQ